MGLTDRMNEVEMVYRALAFWGLGQVGVAIKGPTGVLYGDPYLADSDGGGREARAQLLAPARARGGHQRLGCTPHPRPRRSHRPRDPAATGLGFS